MTKKEAVSRWHVIRTRFDKAGPTAELDSLATTQISVRVKSAQSDLSELVEWGYLAWDDVVSCFQYADEEKRYVAFTFKPDQKTFDAPGEEEEDD